MIKKCHMCQGRGHRYWFREIGYIIGNGEPIEIPTRTQLPENAAFQKWMWHPTKHAKIEQYAVPCPMCDDSGEGYAVPIEEVL